MCLNAFCSGMFRVIFDCSVGGYSRIETTCRVLFFSDFDLGSSSGKSWELSHWQEFIPGLDNSVSSQAPCATSCTAICLKISWKYSWLQGRPGKYGEIFDAFEVQTSKWPTPILETRPWTRSFSWLPIHVSVAWRILDGSCRLLVLKQSCFPGHAK